MLPIATYSADADRTKLVSGAPNFGTFQCRYRIRNEVEELSVRTTTHTRVSLYNLIQDLKHSMVKDMKELGEDSTICYEIFCLRQASQKPARKKQKRR